MALDVRILREAFRATLRAAGEDLASIRLLHENRRLKLTKDTTRSKCWLREDLTIFEEVRSSTGLIEVYGELTYEVYGLRGRGTEIVDALAKEIAEAFEAGSSISATGMNISVERAQRGPGGLDDDPNSDIRLQPGPSPGPSSVWYRVPVYIKWRVFTPALT